MRKKSDFIFVFACLTLCLLINNSYAAAQVGQVTKKEAVAAKNSLGVAPNFDLQDVYLDSYKLSDYKGKAGVLLFFWTTWCPYCQKELSVLSSMYPELKKKGIEVFAIDTGERMDRVQSFVKRKNIIFKVLLDSDGTVGQRYDLIGVPTYFLIDKQGNIVFKNNYFPAAAVNDMAKEK